MAHGKQADLLDPSAQGELFEAPAEPAYRPNLDKVRARLEKLPAEARAPGDALGAFAALPLPAHFPADGAVAAGR